MLGHWQLRGWGSFLVEERETGVLAGCVGISDWEGWPEPELGWWTVPTAWGHGYATEAARTALDYFGSLSRTNRLVSFVPAANTASVRVAEKLGALYERDIELHGMTVRVYAHSLNATR
jgi:RimJ/RimL family protein N-acetyltransferase